jgi:hypothetical protein
MVLILVAGAWWSWLSPFGENRPQRVNDTISLTSLLDNSDRDAYFTLAHSRDLAQKGIGFMNRLTPSVRADYMLVTCVFVLLGFSQLQISSERCIMYVPKRKKSH